jgi:hypothetical protein
MNFIIRRFVESPPAIVEPQRQSEFICSGCGAARDCNCNAPALKRVAEYDKANPGRSTRQAAEDLGINQSTVARARQSGDASASSESSETVTGSDGKRYAARQPRRTQAEKQLETFDKQIRWVWNVGEQLESMNIPPLELFGQIEANKRTRGVSATVSRPATPPAPAVKLLKVDTTLSDDELMVSVEKHMATLKTLRDLPDPVLQKELSRPVLLLLIDELKTLDARLSA